MIRIILIVLVVINLVFATYARFIDTPPVPNDRKAREIAPDKIVIISRDKEPPPANLELQPKPVVTAMDVPSNKEACLLWSGLSENNVIKLEMMPQTQTVGMHFERLESIETKGYWVFIPDLANRSEAERRLEELKRLNVTDYQIAPPSAANNRFSISLGFFSTDSAAKSRQQELRSKGILNTRIQSRDPRTVYSFRIKGSEQQISLWREAARSLVQEGNSETCPGN